MWNKNAVDERMRNVVLAPAAALAPIAFNLTSTTSTTQRAIARRTLQVRLSCHPETLAILLTHDKAQPQPCSPHSAEWVRPSTLRCQTTPSRSTPSARSTDSWPPASAPPCGSSYVGKLAPVAPVLIEAVDVPREEGWSGSPRLEAPLGPLNDELKRGGERTTSNGIKLGSSSQEHCTYASGRRQK